MNQYKKDFKVLQNHPEVAYLDNAASSLKPECVVEAMDYYYDNLGCNVHRGVYQLSYEASDLYEGAREIIGKFIGAKTEEVVFTRGASASLNLVAHTFGKENINAGDEVIVSELEHHSNLIPWINICKEKGAILKYVPLTKEGRITVENFKTVLSDKTKLVALCHVSNVMGYITPVKEIVELAHEKGAYVVLDGAQAIPHMKINVKDLDCDFYAFSGHKMCGPTGVGVLYGKKALLDRTTPLEFGGDMADEVFLDHATYKDTPYKFEAGTPMIAEVIGLGRACEYLDSIGFDYIEKEEHRIKEYCLEQLQKIEGLEIYNPSCETGVITLNIKGVHPHDAASVLDKNNVCIRAGHHCAQPITRFLGQIATIRASFYFFNDETDADKFVKSIQEAVDFFGMF